MSSTASDIWTAILLLSVVWQVAAAKNMDATDAPQTGNELTLEASLRQFPPSFGMGGGIGGGGFGGGCPLCDSSVYSYCSHKVVHDACCCDFPVAQRKPPQCYYYDCGLLYAKSCYEHMLIKNCCCNNPYR